MDIDEFLQARQAEDQELAELQPPWPWHVGDDPTEVIAEDDIEVATAFALSGNQQRNVAAFIARHDPQRVLDELAVRRRVLERHRRLVDVDPSWAGHDWANNCYWCGDSTYDQYRVDINDCPELCDQAAPFAEHPDYEERWKP